VRAEVDTGVVVEVTLVRVTPSMLVVEYVDDEGVSQLVDVAVPGTLPASWP
jgi:hypothetical protein